MTKQKSTPKAMTFQVMDRTGHTTMEFDKSSEAVTSAMKKFDELVKGQKYMAARRDAPGRLTQIRAFDPNAEEIVFVPPMQGG